MQVEKDRSGRTVEARASSTLICGTGCLKGVLRVWNRLPSDGRDRWDGDNGRDRESRDDDRREDGTR